MKEGRERDTECRVDRTRNQRTGAAKPEDTTKETTEETTVRYAASIQGRTVEINWTKADREAKPKEAEAERSMGPKVWLT